MLGSHHPVVFVLLIVGFYFIVMSKAPSGGCYIAILCNYTHQMLCQYYYSVIMDMGSVCGHSLEVDRRIRRAVKLLLAAHVQKVPHKSIQ